MALFSYLFSKTLLVKNQYSYVVIKVLTSGCKCGFQREKMFASQIQKFKLAEVLRSGKHYTEMGLNRGVIASVLKASSSLWCISELGSDTAARLLCFI